MAAAHGRVQHLEAQHRDRRIEPRQSLLPRGPRAAVPGQLPRARHERPQPLLGQRLQGLIHDQIDQLLRGIEAAAVLAGVGCEANPHPAAGGAHRFPFQQAFVDRTELLHRHVAVVDEAPHAVGSLAGARLADRGMAEIVDHLGGHRVRHPDALQQRRRLGREQAAVVGRQADRRIAPVDLPEQLGQVVVVVAGGRGEGIPCGHPARHLVAHPPAQAVVIVARVVDRQQPPVLGVEQEQQPIEEDQRCRADFRQAGAIAGRGGDRRHQAREHALEDDRRQVLRDRLLVALALDDGCFEEGGGRRTLQRKGGAPEQQPEDAQAILGAGLQHLRQIGFEEPGRARAGAGVVQAPHAAVGQDAPPQAVFGSELGGRQVAQHLTVRRAAAAVAVVEREPEALAFLHHQGVLKARAGVGARRGPRLGGGVGEQQVVGDVLAAGGALLRQVVAPSQQRQHRADQVLLGHRLVGLVQRREPPVAAVQAVPEVGELRRRGLPLRRRADAVGQKVLSEQLPLHQWSGATISRPGAAALRGAVSSDLICRSELLRRRVTCCCRCAARS